MCQQQVQLSVPVHVCHGATCWGKQSVTACHHNPVGVCWWLCDSCIPGKSHTCIRFHNTIHLNAHDKCGNFNFFFSFIYLQTYKGFFCLFPIMHRFKQEVETEMCFIRRLLRLNRHQHVFGGLLVVQCWMSVAEDWEIRPSASTTTEPRVVSESCCTNKAPPSPAALAWKQTNPPCLHCVTPSVSKQNCSEVLPVWHHDTSQQPFWRAWQLSDWSYDCCSESVNVPDLFHAPTALQHRQRSAAGSEDLRRLAWTPCGQEAVKKSSLWTSGVTLCRNFFLITKIQDGSLESGTWKACWVQRLCKLYCWKTHPALGRCQSRPQWLCGWAREQQKSH